VFWSQFPLTTRTFCQKMMSGDRKSSKLRKHLKGNDSGGHDSYQAPLKGLPDGGLTVPTAGKETSMNGSKKDLIFDKTLLSGSCNIGKFRLYVN